MAKELLCHCKHGAEHHPKYDVCRFEDCQCQRFNEIDCHEELLAAAKYFRSLVDADLLDAMTRDGNPHEQAIAKAEASK